MSRSRPRPSLLLAGVAAASVSACRGGDALGAWPARLVARAAVQQEGLVGVTVNDPPAVQLLDADGNPISGAEITFTVTAGNGSVTGGTATTGSDGIAAASAWVVQSGTNEVTASIPAPFRVAPVTFQANGVTAAYHISLTYVTPTTPGREAVFAAAAARWEQAIYGDLPDLTVNLPAGSCFGNEPAISQTIDDLLIFVTLDSIDGPGQILGASSPCFIRSAGDLSLIGAMVFDTADVAMLEADGFFDEVILHEMGHVIGFGTLWDPGLLNLIAEPTFLGGTDPHFIGAQAVAAFDRVGGTSYTASAKVPVENTGGAGTADSHWRRTVFKNELMTGFLNPADATHPLSLVTVASLQDEGYRVSFAAADQYALTLAAALPSPGAPGAGRVLALDHDILRLPIRVVDRSGRIIGVYQR